MSGKPTPQETEAALVAVVALIGALSCAGTPWNHDLLTWLGERAALWLLLVVLIAFTPSNTVYRNVAIAVILLVSVLMLNGVFRRRWRAATPHSS
jgi:low affinity Fe/Cu permease